MSDLIDRAALREQFDAGRNEYEPGEEEPTRVNRCYTGDEVLALIDAAPAISCGECERYERCPLVQSRIDRGLCSAGFGCGDFEGRQP